MTIDAINDKIFDIAFFMNFGDGTSKDEIEYVIAWAAFQPKGSVRGDRSFGGSFGSFEQQTANIEQKTTEFQINLVNSIYSVNQSRNFNPYIVLGGDYIITKQDGVKLNVLVMWILLQDINKLGITTLKGIQDK